MHTSVDQAPHRNRFPYLDICCKKSQNFTEQILIPIWHVWHGRATTTILWKWELSFWCFITNKMSKIDYKTISLVCSNTLSVHLRTLYWLKHWFLSKFLYRKSWIILEIFENHNSQWNKNVQSNVISYTSFIDRQLKALRNSKKSSKV